ncbi:hypothetical protein ANTPLA_LOCUS10339 [Anthophora plagiata]
MADGPSAEYAATNLGESDSRLTRDRHKRQDAASSITLLSTVQDIARRVHEDATVLENHPQQYHRQQYRPLRRNCHTYLHPSRRHSGNANANNNHNSNGNINNNNHHHNHHYHRREHEENEMDCNERFSKNESGIGIDTMCVLPFTSPTNSNYNDYDMYGDEEDDDDDDDDEEEEYEEENDTVNAGKKKGVSKKYRGGVVRIDVVTKTVKKNGENDSVNSNSNGNGSSNNNHNGSYGGEGGAMTGHATRGDNAASSLTDGRRSRSAAVVVAFLDASAPNDRFTTAEMTESRRMNRDNGNLHVQHHVQEMDEDEDENEGLKKSNSRFGCDSNREISREDEDAVRKTDGNASDGSSSSSSSSSSSDGGNGGSGAAAAAAVSPSGGAGAAGVTANGLVAGRHQGSPFKGQVRTAEDTLVGPCGKKRCADRYDSSESSDRNKWLFYGNEGSDDFMRFYGYT